MGLKKFRKKKKDPINVSVVCSKINAEIERELAIGRIGGRYEYISKSG